MANDLKKLLVDAGLLPSEAKVYLSSLEIGPATVQNIAKKAGISRTAAYDAIELLKDRGLITSSLHGKRRLFSSEEPGRIVSYLKEEKTRFESTLAAVEDSVSAFKLLAGGIRPSVRVYEGEEAIHAYFDHVAKTKPEQFDEISNLDDVYTYLDGKTVSSARRSYVWGKFKSARLLHVGELRNPRQGVKFRKLGAKWGEFHGNITIYGNFIALVTFVGKVSVVIIESRELAGTMRTMFDVVWSDSKPSR